MSHTRLCFVAAFFPLLLLTSSAPADDSASTPEQLIHQLAEASKNGNPDAFLSHLTTESRKAIDESLEDQASLRRSQENFQHALNERFGEGRRNLTLPAKDFKSVLRRINAFELLSTKEGPGGTLELRVKTSFENQAEKAGERSIVHEDTFVARKQNGIWKLELNPGNSAHMMAEKAALDRVAAAVRNGEFGDTRSALLELRRVLFLGVRISPEHRVALGTEKTTQGKPHLAGAPPIPNASTAVILAHPGKIPIRP